MELLSLLPLFGKVSDMVWRRLTLQSFEEDITITSNPLSMIEQTGVRNSLHKLITDPKIMISPYRI